MTGTDDAPGPDVPATELGYAAARRELEAIVAELDGDAVDVDHLATRVRRAAELIAACRSRIAEATLEVTQVVAGLDEVGGPSAEP